LSRLFGQEFPHPSNTSDKEALFIPTGLDSEEMISQSADLTVFLDKIEQQMKADGLPCDEIEFNDVVKKPVKKQMQKREEV